MNKLAKIIFAILGAFNVLIDLMMPITVAIVWSYFFELSESVSIFVWILGGLATIFKGIKFGGWIHKDE